MSQDKPVGHEPTGFPILIDPDLQEKIVNFKVEFDDSNAQLQIIADQVKVLRQREEALRDVAGHAATGIRIAQRDLIASNDLPDNVRLNIDVEARTVELVEDRMSGLRRVQG